MTGHNTSLKLGSACSTGGFRMDGYWVWCGSVVQGDDGRYHMFASRWPQRYQMHPGWTFHSEIVRASSDTPEGPYQFEEVVLERRDPRYFDAAMSHNPCILKHQDTYLLFYTGVSYEEDLNDPAIIAAIGNDPERYARYWNRKRIGLATSASVFGPWQRPDRPALESVPGSWDETITSNAAPCLLDDGSVYLMYKSNKLNESVRGPFNLGMARAEHWSKPFERLSSEPVFTGNIEDPYLWHADGKFHAIMKDMSGAVCGEHHGGIYACSDDALDWNLPEASLAYSRTVSWDNGETTEQSSRERPQLLFHDGKPTHLFNATGNGVPGKGFNSCTRTWNMVTPFINT